MRECSDYRLSGLIPCYGHNVKVFHRDFVKED